ncbi:DUF3987 domain-containing protein [Nitrospira sp. Nam74]
MSADPGIQLEHQRIAFQTTLARTQAALAILAGERGDPSHKGQRTPEAVAAAPSVAAGEAWPTLDAAALHGVCGDIVRTLAPCTEADPIALLASLLGELGTLIGPQPHLVLDGCRHSLRIWVVLCGLSSKSRKGTADKRTQPVIQRADPSWTRGLYKGTLSSGEGLVYAVRDPQFREEPVKLHGKPTGEMQRICVDLGIEDKRLFLVQSEFGAVLKVMGRTGNSLSGIIRDAWDGSDLAPMTKNERIRATAPHIGIVGHVTKDELLRHLDDTEKSNGFANRFLWLLVKRSKELPFPLSPPEAELTKLTARLAAAIESAKILTEIGMTAAARDVWQSTYSSLSADQPGLAGTLLARGEAHVMRIAGLYAALDGQACIDRAHLVAALALWDYAEASTRHIFGQALGDPIADTILRAVREKGSLDNSAISGLFARHESAARLDRVKASLTAAGLIHCVEVGTGGRPRTVWRLGAKQAKEEN